MGLPAAAWPTPSASTSLACVSDFSLVKIFCEWFYSERMIEAMFFMTVSYTEYFQW